MEREISNPIMETERGEKMNNETETGIMYGDYTD